MFADISPSGSTWSNWPDLNQFLRESWGWGTETYRVGFCGASNVVMGINPPYGIGDFLAVYPKFGGVPILLTGTMQQNSPVITNLSSVASLIPGMLVATVIPSTLLPVPSGTPPPATVLMPGAFPPNTTILSIDSSKQITLSNGALTGTINQVAIYNASFVTQQILTYYVYLATNSIIQRRWQEMWQLGMALFIAHYSTLFLMTDGNPASSPNQALYQGMLRGPVTSKSAANVSVSMDLTGILGGQQDWGMWNATTYGALLATMARGIGAGPSLQW